MKGPAVRIAAQAKLNLHLRVLSRDVTGFHSLETIFHRIDLADDLIVEATDGEKTLDVEGGDTGPVKSNLAWRAADGFASRAGWPRGFRIELTKRIPMGAGMGGGSANAAAVLRGLNSIAPHPLPQQELLRLAASLGSDVPFLASSAVMALGWGRGERLLSLSPLPRHDLLLTTPEFSVSTADAYRWLDEDRARHDESSHRNGLGQPDPEPIAIDTVDVSTWTGIARFARNDFEAPVTARFPRLSEYMDRLRNSRAIFVQMTGSGSTIFGVLNSAPNCSTIPGENRGRVTTTRTSIDVVQPERIG